jgi:hypothetical protein
MLLIIFSQSNNLQILAAVKLYSLQNLKFFSRVTNLIQLKGELNKVSGAPRIDFCGLQVSCGELNFPVCTVKFLHVLNILRLFLQHSYWHTGLFICWYASE